MMFFLGYAVVACLEAQIARRHAGTSPQPQPRSLQMQRLGCLGVPHASPFWWFKTLVGLSKLPLVGLCFKGEEQCWKPSLCTMADGLACDFPGGVADAELGTPQFSLYNPERMQKMRKTKIQKMRKTQRMPRMGSLQKMRGLPMQRFRRRKKRKKLQKMPKTQKIQRMGSLRQIGSRQRMQRFRRGKKRQKKLQSGKRTWRQIWQLMPIHRKTWTRRGGCHMGMGQSKTTRGPQVLVHVSIHHGSIFGLPYV